MRRVLLILAALCFAGTASAGVRRAPRLDDRIIIAVQPSSAITTTGQWGSITLSPAQGATISRMSLYVYSASAGGTNLVVRVSDGTNNCDATFSCTADTNTTGAKSKTTTGSCAFAPGAALTLSVSTEGCTTDASVRNIIASGTSN